MFGKGGLPEADSLAKGFKLKRIRQLGSGSQGEVFLCKVDIPGKPTITCVNKLKKAFNNPELSVQFFEEMYKEFSIGRMLEHPGIV